jgi:hypothetical protein
MNQEKLAINGGERVRTEPLPLEFPGIHHMGDEEIEAAVRILRRRSFFRYLGSSCRGKWKPSRRSLPDT